MKYKNLAINDPVDLRFGLAPNPVKTKRGLIIGGGTVYPELNFTMPPIEVSLGNLKELKRQYSNIAREALQRAYDLHSPGVILEFETVVEMTQFPQIGIEIIEEMNKHCESFHHNYGFKSEIRLTPNDLRDFDRPPKPRSSSYLDPMMELFEKGAMAGGDLLSIESTGGKEISDDALMMCDIRQFIFSQSVLGVRDMKMLWGKIVETAQNLDKIPAGDTACAFGNTAMVLAEKKFIPKIFAAIARVATVVRSLIAYEMGAQGPNKDCGYEGPFLKAITGVPISMEGKAAACAHFSPLGNITAAAADLWSNESVQNIKLLSGMAPVVSMEQLEYDVRLMNTASRTGPDSVNNLKHLFTASDSYYDPQAFILTPENVINISREIVGGKDYLDATKSGCIKAMDLILKGFEEGRLLNDEKESSWFDQIRAGIESIPNSEAEFISDMLPMIDHSKIDLKEYGL